MSNFVNTITQLGDEATVASIIGRTITEFNDDIITTIGNNAFKDCERLKTLNIPNVTTLEVGAFENCVSLESFNSSSITSMSSSFKGCTSLESVNITAKNISLMGDCFVGCTSLKSFSATKVTYIGQRAFQNCSSLVSFTYSESTIGKISDYTFQGCSSLASSLTFPTVTELWGSAFKGCSLLPNVYLPSLTTMTNGSQFADCTSLVYLDFPKLGKIERLCFQNCYALKTLILRKDTAICTLNNINAFDGTPFASGGTGGKVLTPRSFIEPYQTGTNWSTLYAAGSCTFLALEDYTIDGTITGEIDWDKLNGGTT